METIAELAEEDELEVHEEVVPIEDFVSDDDFQDVDNNRKGKGQEENGIQAYSPICSYRQSHLWTNCFLQFARILCNRVKAPPISTLGQVEGSMTHRNNTIKNKTKLKKGINQWSNVRVGRCVVEISNQFCGVRGVAFDPFLFRFFVSIIGRSTPLVVLAAWT